MVTSTSNGNARNLAFDFSSISALTTTETARDAVEVELALASPINKTAVSMLDRCPGAVHLWIVSGQVNKWRDSRPGDPLWFWKARTSVLETVHRMWQKGQHPSTDLILDKVWPIAGTCDDNDGPRSRRELQLWLSAYVNIDPFSVAPGSDRTILWVEQRMKARYTTSIEDNKGRRLTALFSSKPDLVVYRRDRDAGFVIEVLEQSSGTTRYDAYGLSVMAAIDALALKPVLPPAYEHSPRRVYYLDLDDCLESLDVEPVDITVTRRQGKEVLDKIVSQIGEVSEGNFDYRPSPSNCAECRASSHCSFAWGPVGKLPEC